MNSIYRRLTKTLAIMLTAIIIVYSVVTGVSIYTIYHYDLTIDRAVGNASILKKIDTLVTAYGNTEKEPRLENLRLYNESVSDLNLTIREMETNEFSDGNRLLFDGIKKEIGEITNIANNGIININSGDTTAFLNVYETIKSKSETASKLTSEFILAELEYYSQIDERLDWFGKYVSIGGTSAIIVVVLVIYFLGINFAKKFTAPLIDLSRLSQIVGQGNFDVNVKEDLKSQNDEIGMLAKSFDVMVDTLKDSIDKLKESNEQTMKAKAKLEEANEELSKMNKFMVNREVAMIKLKERISELESKTEK